MRSARGAARRGLARTAPSRWPRARSAWSHHRGSRPGAGWRSAPRAPQAGPSPVPTAPVAPPDPPHVRAANSCAVWRGDSAGKTVMHVRPQCFVRRELRGLGPPRAPVGAYDDEYTIVEHWDGSAAGSVAPDRRGRALAMIVAGSSAGTAFGVPLGAYAGGFAGWRPVFFGVTAAVALADA